MNDINNKEEALDALYTVLVDGITADDISFTEEEHTRAILAYNFFRKQGAGERNRWLATVDSLISDINTKMWSSFGAGEEVKKRSRLQAQREVLEELKTRMEENQ